MKKLKIIFVSILSFIFLFIIFIIIEVVRFNNNLYIKPMIQIGPIETKIEVGNNIHNEKMKGIGYTLEYEYVAIRKEDSDHQTNKLVSGNFKLFGKFMIFSWIE